MTPTEYRKLRLEDMTAKRWRTRVRLETRGGDALEAGREVQIVNKRGGLDLACGPCAHCGVTFEIRGVHPSNVEEVL